MKEFFGFVEDTRIPEGFLSWQHLLFVTSLMIIMIVSAVLLGKKYKNEDAKVKNKVLIVAAILIDSFELFKIIIFSARSNNPLAFLYELPLFLCSIQLLTIPLAAFAKGELKEAAKDFVLIFGILGAVFGTYGAGQNYNCYPVLSFDNVVSGITHSISGFCSLYIAFSGLTSLKKENIYISYLILFTFCLLAYTANYALDYNYMFLVRGDGTPYDIFYNLVNGNKILYPLIVAGLFVLYITLFYYVYYLIIKIKKKKKIETNKTA